MEDFESYVDDDNSSYCSLTDSDKIDSETEAELYSKIHYDNISYTNSENLNEKSSEFLIHSPFNGIFCVDTAKYASTPIKHTSEHLFLNQITRDDFSSGKRKSSEINSNCDESKLNLKKKHKSSSVRDLSDVNLYPDSKNIDDDVVFVSNLKNKSNKKIDTVIIDSSDSDSDFWIESSSAEKSDLQINLLKDTNPVFLCSSSSDDNSDASSPIVKRNSVFKNLTMPFLKMEENAKDLWRINSEDLFRSKRYSRRYHENIDVTCSNCNKKGHTFRSCPSPRVIKCFFCGGNHLGSRCSSRICSNCYAYGHDRRSCWQKINTTFCHLCKVEGHGKGNCPDLWRRYHLTTEPSTKLNKPKQVQQDANIYCWNCGHCGHFGSLCPTPHVPKSNFNTWPCVISYNSPMKILKSDRLPFLRRFPHLNLAKQENHLHNISCASGKQDIHLKSRNELNVSSGSNEENRENKGKKKLKTDLRFNKVQDIVKEKNFPRTPKEKSPMKPPKVFDQSANEAVSTNSLIKKELKMLKKRWINHRKAAGLEVSETIQPDFEMNFDDNLPGSVKQYAKWRFKRWKRSYLNKLKRRRKRNESKVKMDVACQHAAAANELDLFIMGTLILPEEVVKVCIQSLKSDKGTSLNEVCQEIQYTSQIETSLLRRSVDKFIHKGLECKLLKECGSRFSLK